MRKLDVKTEDEVFEVKVAETLFQRMKGLSFCGEGKMLFVFSRDTKASIDMMFLSKPLYLYFLNEEKRVIDVQKAEPWTKNPLTWKLYSPDESYRYLLESFEPLEGKKGDEFKFDL